MKSALKIFAYIILLLITAAVVFITWASSPTLQPEAYHAIHKKSFKAEVDNDSIYSIVSYNVGYLSGMANNRAVAQSKQLYQDNLKALKQQLTTTNADIIAFQEIDFNANRSLNVNQLEETSSLGYPYLAQAINWDETYLPFPGVSPSTHYGKIVSGQAIASKYDITSQERIVLERVKTSPWHRDIFYLDRLAQIAKITIQNQEVVVINVHLEAFDVPTRRSQTDAVLELYKQYENDYPTILLGDFNSDKDEDNATITKILNHPGLGNAAYAKGAIKNTFNSEMPVKRIDYIFYNTSKIDYVDGEVLTQFGQISDHLPVAMRFKLKS